MFTTGQMRCLRDNHNDSAQLLSDAGHIVARAGWPCCYVSMVVSLCTTSPCKPFHHTLPSPSASEERLQWLIARTRRHVVKEQERLIARRIMEDVVGITKATSGLE
jgi:hypothetical protein